MNFETKVRFLKYPKLLKVYKLYELLKYVIAVVKGKEELRNVKLSIANYGSIFGENFKEYLIKHNMPQVIEALKKGLDEESKSIIDTHIDRLLNLPLRDTVYANILRCADPCAIMLPSQAAKEAGFISSLVRLKKQYLGEYSYFPQETFYYHHGLKGLDKRVLDRLKNRVIIDAGAWVGDSSVVFNEYSPFKVYAFEMNSELKSAYYSNLRANKIDTDKFIFVAKGLSNKNETVEIGRQDYLKLTMQGSYTAKTLRSSQKSACAELVKLDNFCKQQGIDNVGLVQMDIEGAEYNAVLGAEEIIRRDRPLLSIAVYHTPQQFFELKPLIESWQLGYKFMVRELSGSPHMETTLLCVPSVD